MANYSNLANIQYSRLKNKILTDPGLTPSIPVVATASYGDITEEDYMVLNQFSNTDLLDGEIVVNTTDNRIWIRSDDEILELRTLATASGLPPLTENNIWMGNISNLATEYALGEGFTIVGSTISVAANYDNLYIESTGSTSTIRKNSGATASGNYNSVLGGLNNTASGAYHSSVLTGCNNKTYNAPYNYIVGGRSNSNSAYHAFIGAGFENTTTNAWTIVGHGRCNTSSGAYSGIFNGDRNSSQNSFSTIVNGNQNKSIPGYGFIGNGQTNTVGANGISGFIGNGTNNTLDGQMGVIGSGCFNAIDSTGLYSFIGSGCNNTLSQACTFIGSGLNNTVDGQYGTIVNGQNNYINVNSTNGYIGNGDNNQLINAVRSTIIGGVNNINNGFTESHIIGSNITATASCTTFVNNFNINNTPVTNNVNDNIIVRNATTGQIELRDASTITPSAPTASDLYILSTGVESTIRKNTGASASGGYSVVSGGELNEVTGTHSNVGAGLCNSVDGEKSYILNGENNYVNGLYSGILNGSGNNANGTNLTIINGTTTTISGNYGVAVGPSHTSSGNYNFTNGVQNTITGNGNFGGGASSNITGNYNSIVNGSINIIKGNCSHISTGSNNYILGTYSSIGGGTVNQVKGYISTIGGGNTNCIEGDQSVIAGGNHNKIIGDFSSSASGCYNYTNGNLSSITGGYFNTIIGTGSHLSGGGCNTLVGNYSGVEGYSNNLDGDFSYVMGSGSTVSGDFNFVSGTTHTVSGNYISVLGQNITATYSNHSYVNNLVIDELPTLDNSNNYLLTRNNSTGQVEYREATSISGGGTAATIYNSDGTLSGARIVSMAGNDLTFSNGKTTLKGTGSTSATTVLLTQNSSSSTTLQLLDDASLGVGITPTSALTIKAKSVGSDGGIRLIGFTTGTDISYWSETELAMQYGGTFYNVISSNGDSYFNGGDVGIGITTPGARLNVKGSGSTSASNSLLVQNSSSTTILKTEDDGGIFIGVTPASSGTASVLARNTTTGEIETRTINSIKPTLGRTLLLDAPTASDDITIFRTDVDITVQEVIAVSTGTTPSTTYQLKHSTDRSAAGNALTTSGTTTSTTTGDTATLSDDTIPANSWIWLETTAASGTSVILSVDIRYTED